METKLGYRKMIREEIIESLGYQIRGLKKEKTPENDEVVLLKRALKIEKQVLESKSRDVSDFFYTGYAGRKVVVWNYMDGEWKGQLCNRESRIVKREWTGETAEEILRHLLPNKRLTDESLVRIKKVV